MNIPNIVNDIYDVFKEFYTEDKVDLQTYGSQYRIYVYWPEVEVTNEFDEHVTIWKLFGEVTINRSGELAYAPRFNRAEYNTAQWESNYMHSHVNVIPKGNLTDFQASCLGSGPIRYTITKLKSDSYTDLVVWRLFCWELDKYVHVESVSGVPYHRMSSIGNYGHANRLNDMPVMCSWNCSVYYEHMLNSYLNDLVPRWNIPLRFIEGSYTIGMSYVDSVLAISNDFIAWYNSHPEIRKVYTKTQLIDNRIVYEATVTPSAIMLETGSVRNTIEEFIGRRILTFKGNQVLLTARDSHESETRQVSLILRPELISYIFYKVLSFVNYKYGKSENAINRKTVIL